MKNAFLPPHQSEKVEETEATERPVETEVRIDEEKVENPVVEAN